MDRLSDGLTRFGAAGRNDHMCTLSSEAAGDTLTNSLARARDNGRSTFEPAL
jgi:hypothetical protein